MTDDRDTERSTGRDTRRSSHHWDLEDEEEQQVSQMLKKRSTFSSWKEVFMVAQAGMLLEFKRPTSDKPKRSFPLADCHVESAEHFTNDPNTFAVTCKGKNAMYFKCPDKESTELWMRVLLHHMEEKERQSISTPSEFVRTLTNASVVSGQTGTILAVNEQLTKLIGWTSDDLVGQSVEKLMDPSIAKVHAHFMQRYMDTGEKRLIGKPRVMEVVRKDGSKVRLELCLGEVPSWANTSGGTQTQFVGQLATPVLTYDKEGIDEMMDAVMFSTFQTAKMELQKKVSEQMYQMVETISHLQKEVADRGAGQDWHDMTDDDSTIGDDSSGSGAKDRVVEVMRMIHKGGGSGAQVHLARVDGWNCVMKAITIGNANKHELMALSNEISVLENLPYHRNLVRYLFHRTQNDRIEIFVTQYECTLGEMIKKKREAGETFSAKEICQFLLDILHGIMTLHSRKIVHRDLKPENIFVSFNETGAVSSLAVGDFDTAKSVSAKAQQHTVVGTPGYMAPEVLMNGKYSFPVDVFGIGMILYEVLTLQRPYHDESNMYQISQMIIAGKFPKVDETGMDETKKQLSKLYLKCAHLKPSKRPKLKSVKASLVKLMVAAS